MDTPRPSAERLSELTEAERARAHELIERIRACDAAIARAEGEKAAHLAELASIAADDGSRSSSPDGPEQARRAMAAEVAAATRQHPATAGAQLGEAQQLVDDYPATHEALREGRISRRHASVIAEAGAHLSGAQRAVLDETSVPLAERRTPGELRRLAAKRASDLAPRSLEERHRDARERRRVAVTDREDGMSELYALGPSLEIHAVYDRLTGLARVVKGDRRRARRAFRRRHGHLPGDPCPEGCACASAHANPGSCSRPDAAGHTPGDSCAACREARAAAATDLRTMDQLRADLLADALLTAAPTAHELHSSGAGASLAAISASVQVTIPAAQLARSGGHGPAPRDDAAWIDAGTLVSPLSARLLAGCAPGWDRLFADPQTGEVVASDRYRPSAQQRRELVGRDMTCRFPGCATPARRADIDHTRDWARGGATEVDNLAVLCEAHHRMKHVAGWSAVQRPGGVIAWTSPAGHETEAAPHGAAFRASTRGASGPAAPALGWSAPPGGSRPGHDERRAEWLDQEDERSEYAAEHLLTPDDLRELAFADALARGDIPDPNPRLVARRVRHGLSRPRRPRL